MINRIKLTGLVLLSILFKSNDTAIHSIGSDLFPIQESDISIQKEELKLSLNGDMHVDVYFEFNNPSEEKELLVGFVTPPQYEPMYLDNDSINIDSRVPEISDFNVIVNGADLPYKVGLLKDTHFEDLKSKEGKWQYVYYFKATFKKGINIVTHSYSFSGGFDSMGGRIYGYVLKTANNWAGHGIKDFKVIIDMGKDAEFSIQPISKSEWVLKGIGQKDKNTYFIRDGQLEFSSHDFKPQHDIDIYMPSRINLYDQNSVAFQAELAEIEQLKELDKSRLRIIRNYYFAREGYNFSSTDLKDFYSQFIWYIPDDKLSTKQIYDSFDPKLQERINSIKELENTK